MLTLVLVSLYTRGQNFQWDPRKNKSLSLRIFAGIGVGASVQRNDHEDTLYNEYEKRGHRDWGRNFHYREKKWVSDRNRTMPPERLRRVAPETSSSPRWPPTWADLKPLEKEWGWRGPS
ncbi:hypothetical protein J6590_061508 [Homalodisca vitripennis]|nr:hypothetical protein J6590_061508 [Homalodisca vitripennis]